MQQSNAQLERAWKNLMEQKFTLIYWGKMSFEDVMKMPTEDRIWMINRLHEQIEKENDQQNNRKNL